MSDVSPQREAPFDQNLARHLIDDLRDVFPYSAHVALLGLAEATDAEVWAYVGASGYMVVSKGSDFRQLAFLPRSPAKSRVGPAR